MSGALLAAYSLWHREVIRFFRARSRVIGAVAPPLLFWVILGAGLGDSFRAGGAFAGVDYLQYFYPGTVTLIVLFASIFASMSLIEDRNEGFVQTVLVAPVPRASLVFGKILGITTLAFLQGLPLIALAPLVGLGFTAQGFIYMSAVLFMTAMGLAGLGFAIAWRLDSAAGFHAIINLFLMPMWMLSGALFPVSGASPWLRVLTRLNPMTYGFAAVQQSFRVNGVPLREADFSHAVCLGVVVLFALLMSGLSLWVARRPAAQS